jgi:hypothetical protein
VKIRESREEEAGRRKDEAKSNLPAGRQVNKKQWKVHLIKY